MYDDGNKLVICSMCKHIYTLIPINVINAMTHGAIDHEKCLYCGEYTVCSYEPSNE